MQSIYVLLIMFAFWAASLAAYKFIWLDDIKPHIDKEKRLRRITDSRMKARKNKFKRRLRLIDTY